ncbi:hypothetical protein [Paenibacillus sp. MABNR03]|uniref:hypothetical protein n=1 Tax=Paenibacillus sp. MABNR03 TaxID=3142626 RepID=UPI003D2DE611
MIKNIEREDNFVVIAENPEGEIIGFADSWKRETNIVANPSDLTSITYIRNITEEV